MKAVRLGNLINPETIESEFEHMEHMYMGRLAPYYYRRFDQALEVAELNQTDRVLVVGVGTGVFGLSLSNLVDDLHITDIARETPLFSTTRQLFDASTLSDEHIDFAAADVRALPYTSDSFDTIFALDVLEHVPDERDAIAELRRVTRPDGRLVVSSPIEVGPFVLIRECYRSLDGGRQLTQSLREMMTAAFGSPTVEQNSGHRGYDYRQTIEWIAEEFDSTTVEYCPFRFMKWVNPTAIISASLA